MEQELKLFKPQQQALHMEHIKVMANNIPLVEATADSKLAKVEVDNTTLAMAMVSSIQQAVALADNKLANNLQALVEAEQEEKKRRLEDLVRGFSSITPLLLKVEEEVVIVLLVQLSQLIILEDYLTLYSYMVVLVKVSITWVFTQVNPQPQLKDFASTQMETFP